MHLSIYLSISLSVYLSKCLSVYLSICLPVYLSICLSVYMSICLSVYLSIYLSICLSIYLSIYLSTCLPVNLSIHLSIHLSIYLRWYLLSIVFLIASCTIIQLYIIICLYDSSISIYVYISHLSKWYNSHAGAQGAPAWTARRHRWSAPGSWSSQRWRLGGRAKGPTLGPQLVQWDDC